MRASKPLIGVLSEVSDVNSIVALAPSHVASLVRIGYRVCVEKNAGIAAGFSNDMYTAVAAEVVSRKQVLEANIILCVNLPKNIAWQQKTCVLGMLNPYQNKTELTKLVKKHALSCYSMELMPRISRAQSMDVLSTLANLAAYKAVILAADHSPKLFPLMMTAAGTVRPAKVFVLGAGVAGLQAIATAKRLGAVVEAYDIRPDTQAQVESVGGIFVKFDLEVSDAQDEGGYARELTEAQKSKQQALMTEKMQSMDVIITTAQVPGRRAPVLVSKTVVETMHPGSVIVDMAASTGGNCALTQVDKIIEHAGVKIIGYANLVNMLAQTASEQYGHNLVNFLRLFWQTGKFKLGYVEDEILAKTCLSYNGKLVSDLIKGESK